MDSLFLFRAGLVPYLEALSRLLRLARRQCNRVGLVSAALLLWTGRSAAQLHDSAVRQNEVFVHSDLENYLRYLQTEGLVSLYPWSIRGFSPLELDRLTPRVSNHPWTGHFVAEPLPDSGRLRLDVVRPRVELRFNSAFPYGSNDGPVWAGRGLTTSVQGGFAARWRWLSATFVPVAFRAENRPFALMPNGESGAQRFSDGLHPTRIDRPQRFGSAPYTILDPGESSLRIDTPFLTLAFSTADQWWGPASEYPFILGNNAAGFPHIALGTGMPVDLWLFKLHARLVYGDLAQTAYSNMPPDSAGARRLMSGAIAIVEPRGVPGLELGVSRFFHSAWPAGGLRWSDIRAPFTPGFKKAIIIASGDSNDLRNQLASVFVRWVAPHGGFEVYGEVGKDDHNWDTRDAILDPDHAETHMVGFRKVWSPSPTRMIALRSEFIDLRFNTLTRSRPLGAGYYTNAELRQGHTERGQLLGADIPGGSGSGSSVALETYTPIGRWTIEWRRTLSDTAGNYSSTGILPVRAPEAQHSLGADAVVFRGPVDFHCGITAVYDINRYFAADRFNLNAVFGTRWNW